jgi:DNA-binding MarR family transcriptional regulator
MENYTTLERVVEQMSTMMAEMETQSSQEERFAELSMRQVFYLNTILKLENPTFSDLARKLKVSKPSVTAIVGTLITKGYAQKVQDANDRRAYHIVVTPKAREFAQLHSAVHKRLADFLAAQLNDDEAEQLARLMAKALQGIKA